MTKKEMLQVITAYQTCINDYVNITEGQLDLIYKSIMGKEGTTPSQGENGQGK